MTKIVKICLKYHIKEGLIHIGCDGKGAIDALNNKFEIVKSSRKHFDIIASIQRLMDYLPLQWKFRHIKAHQDDIKMYDELTRWEQLNVVADTLAKEHMIDMLQDPNWTKERPNWLPMETCAIYWNDRQGRPIRICSNLTNTLRTHIGNARLREYWIGKAKYSPLTERTIDWDSHHKSHKNMASDRHRWLSKWLTGFCGIGITLQLYRHQTHRKCPRCNIDETTVAHVLRCPASAAQQLWLRSISELRSWLDKHDGNPELCDLICENLTAWHRQGFFPANQVQDRLLRNAIKEQDRIGWQSFIEGY